jgi:hypothetical protein
MFKTFAETIGKVHAQLMEGAITYEEFFNKTVAVASNVLSSQRYADFIERNPTGDPMGQDPENQDDADSWYKTQPISPSDSKRAALTIVGVTIWKQSRE